MIDILFPVKDEISRELLVRTCIAHFNASKNNSNGSKIVFSISLEGSGSLIQALSAGLLSTGRLHAPVELARNFIFHWNEKIEEGVVVPGFGHSIFKSEVDPSFKEVDKLLEERFSDKWEMVMERQDELSLLKGKILYRNAAALTACVAECLELPVGMELLLFAFPRMTQWMDSVTSV